MLFTSGHIFVVERGRKYKDFSLFLTTWREISSQFITMRDIMTIQMIYEALILCMFVNPSYQTDVGQADTERVFYYRQVDYPRDCQKLRELCTNPGDLRNGVYVIQPEGLTEPFEVFCDQTTDGGGWTVIQRRIDGSIDFDRNTTYYKDGFGFLNREFWLGNKYLPYLTKGEQVELRIEERRNGSNFANFSYQDFQISDENDRFRLKKLGMFQNNGGSKTDEMSSQVYSEFKTSSESNCRNSSKGGWWFDETDCNKANLNDDFYRNLTRNGLLPYFEMKVRPFNRQ
ncbi:fibrinogen-like protein A [Apostichopus japonicus]|uniref:fibrinogen-like protein A n=1 Tax=Stichopus japonicus TaxID=307972 RepID=UPI003AB31B6B